MANKDNNSGSAIKLSDVEEVIRRNYRPELWQAVKACIGVHTSLSLKGRDHCLVLILEGASGQGKSVAIRTLMPIKDHQSKYAFRVDDFTPAAFVSHAANVSKKKLKELHLLPKIKDKVMLSKELAPVFRVDEKEMRKNFATLTSVLDGDGYVKSTGAQGTEGYVGRYLFNWIGATTPIPDHTHKIMSQLGNRILFFEFVSEEFSHEELLEFAKSYGANDAVKECQEAVSKFIESYFKQRPVNSVDPESVEIGDDSRDEIIWYAELIAYGRVEVEHHKVWDGGQTVVEFEAGQPEGPHRIILLLQTLGRGLALADGRLVVTAEDVALIRHIAFSSIPRKRRELLRALLTAGGSLNTPQTMEAINVSKPTALSRMKELGATGLAEYVPGESKSSTPAKITLADNWNWLLDGTPVKLNRGVQAA